jgi:Transmembrane amino acid transporter protein
LRSPRLSGGFSPRTFSDIVSNYTLIYHLKLVAPVRYASFKLRPGGQSGSVLSLIAATVGAGTLAFPYAIMQNGIAFGTFLIFCGAAISYYSGMLLVEASNHTRRHKYEEIAQTLYGKKFAKMVSFCNLACLLGFAMSFIVYVRGYINNSYIAKGIYTDHHRELLQEGGPSSICAEWCVLGHHLLGKLRIN